MLRGSLRPGSCMGLSMFKFLAMGCSKRTLAPSSSPVGLGDREGAGGGATSLGAPEVLSPAHSPPLPAHLPWSTHRIWYKLKTKLGPGKTAQRERSVRRGRYRLGQPCPSPCPSPCPVEGGAWAALGPLPAGGGRREGERGAALGLRRAASCSFCLLPPAPSSQTESSTFGGQICHWGSLC